MASTTVNFNLKTAGNANFANQTLTFNLLSAGAIGTGDFIALPSSVSATSDANGDGSVTLFRNGDSGIDSVYEVVFPSRERAKFIIPAGTSTIELAKLIVDEVPSGAATQQSSVFAAAIQRANHTGTQALSTISDAGTIASQNSNAVNIDGGAIDGTVIGANSAAAGTFAALTSSSVDINGGAIDGVVIGANSSAVGTFSTLTGPTTNLTGSGDKQFISSAELVKLNAIDADVTTLSLPSATTISDFAKTVLDDTSAAAVKTTLGITDATAQVNFVPRSISFTNTSAYLSLADAPELDVDAGDFSLSFWARLDSSGTEPVLNKLSGTGYRLRFVSGALILTMQDSGGSADFSLATGLNDNKWHTYVVTVDRSGNAIAYVDNVAQTARDVSGTALTLANSGQFQIGSDGGSNAGDGIALGNYIALHKAILSASQAAQIYFSADAALTAVAPALMVDLRKTDKTFTDLSTNGFAVTTNGTIIFNEGRVTSLDGATIGATTPAAVTGTNVLSTTTLGYTTGSGGTVTQGTDKGTAVTLNKISGEIVMNAAALADDASVAFTLNNSTIAATDVVIVNVASVGTAGAYQVTVGAVAAGSCSISVLNVSGGSLSQAIKLNFAVIKAVAS